VEFYDAGELKKIYAFSHFKGTGNDNFGFQNTETQIFEDVNCRDNEGYRLPIIFHDKNIDEFKAMIKSQKIRIKMRVEIINHMDIKTKCRITFLTQLLPENDVFVGNISYSYFNDVEIEYNN
jgi:hypothetical protein